MEQGATRVNPSEEIIKIGPLGIRFLLTGNDSNGSVSVFEVLVPAGQKLAAPAHKNDAYEEILYGIEGVLTWTVDGTPIEVGPGQALCIPRGAVHRFDNLGSTDVRQLAVISPAIMGPAYFREAAEVVGAAGGGPPDRAKMMEVFRRHGMTAAAPRLLSSAISSGAMVPRQKAASPGVWPSCLKEALMRVGFALPQIGSIAGPRALITAAQRAEDLGFDSLWVLDRTLFPVNPRAPYPATKDGTLPVEYKRVLDPLETLTFAAARTSRIALGTSVLNLPWYTPVLLARRLTTLDVLSGGRLRVGFGIGWSPDEYEAAGTPWQQRGKRADELIEVLKRIWTTDPVEFQGEYYRIPKSFIGPKPVQKPHPPIYMAAYTPSAMKRVAKEADGWFPVGIPLGGVAQMFEGIKGMAQEAGRDPETLALIVRGNVEFSDAPLGKDRVDFTGSLEQIADDVVATRKIGAAELLFDIQFSPGVETEEDVVARMEQLWQAAKQS